MLYNRKKIKTISICMILVFLIEWLNPLVAMALTAGPTSPEASSFEPVDTTDMVNPLTGSFTYNTPILEVPGPEGGYPLSLSYHAGIAPDLEASWVGLGWTLNPGAINRSVNGFPDDFSDVNLQRRDYWAGGTRRDYGLSVGFLNSFSVGLVFSNDTYQGFGAGVSVGVGIAGTPLGLNIGTDSYGGISMGMNVTLGSAEKGLHLAPSLGISYGSNSLNAYAGLSLVNNKLPLMGITMSSVASKPNLQVGGGWANTLNNNAGRISTSSKGFGIGIPIFGTGTFIGLSYRYTRYWSDETSYVNANGALYIPPSIDQPYTYLNDRTYDVYRLLDFSQYGIVSESDEYNLQGGSYPDYDHYYVTAQGLSGSIQPHLFQRPLFTQNKTDVYLGLTNIDFGDLSAGVHYRFINDFSNAYRQTLGNIPPHPGPIADVDIPFSNPSDTEAMVGNQLPGSRHIAYFTNAEINVGTAEEKGLIDVNYNMTKGFNRSGKSGSQIGAYMITNESGITYHYALPAYSFDEISYLENSDASKFTSTSRDEEYAYTWLLTAVTGPDYVDRNNNGMADEDDWGYWVAFDYGKWSDSYHWRNPGVGVYYDLEQGYRGFSRGTKEAYYLNSIRTRTHIALFEKETRLDGKGVIKQEVQNWWRFQDYGEASAQSLRLNKIYLFNAGDINLSSIYAPKPIDARPQDFYQHVLDKQDFDLAGRSTLESKAIRIIDFSYDYSLTKRTPNSFSLDDVSSQLGKLTLKQLQTRGKEGTKVLPPMLFEYDIDDDRIAGSLTAYRFTSDNGDLSIGDMLKTVSGIPEYCGVIVSKVMDDNTGKYIYGLRNGLAASQRSVVVTRTKNPIYRSYSTDIWGMYKSDIQRGIISKNENIARMPSHISAQSTDAWSLRKITTVTGAEIIINYESNDYQKAGVHQNQSLIISNIAKINSTTLKATFNSAPPQSLLNDYDSGLNLILLQEKKKTKTYTPLDFPLTSITKEYEVIDNREIASKFLASATIDPIEILLTNTAAAIDGYFYTHDDGGDPMSVQGRTITESKLVVGNLRIVPTQYGGGIRTKSISLDNLDGSVTSTYYSYKAPQSGISSGCTSYLPLVLEPDDAGQFGEDARKLYREKLYANVSQLLSFARDLPAPGVMYEYVTIYNETKHKNGDYYRSGKSTYQYRVFNENMVGQKTMQAEEQAGRTYSRNQTIRDYTSNIGDLLKISHYDKSDKLVSSVSYDYVYDSYVGASHETLSNGYNAALQPYGYQGTIIERFVDARSFLLEADRHDMDWRYTLIMSAKERYPSVPIGQTQHDYITGVKSTTKNLSFDFLNGLPERTMMQDSYGNRFINENIYAYHKYPEMGLKIANEANKHMLSQTAGNVLYKVDLNNDPIGVISASAQTWSNDIPVTMPDGVNTYQDGSLNADGNVWRTKGMYNWLPNSISPGGYSLIAQFIPFQWGGTTIPAGWIQNSEITRYNVFSKPLESYDVNELFTAVRYGYENSKVVVSGSPAKYMEIAFSGAEDETVSGTNTKEVLKGDGTVTDLAAHSGAKSLKLSTGERGFIYDVNASDLTPERDYYACVWVKPASGSASDAKLSYQVNGVTKGASISSGSSNKIAGGWALITLLIKGSDIISGSQLKVALRNDHAIDVFADDFRFQPANAMTNAFVYDESSMELTYILDQNNLYTHFEYDAMGNLANTYTEQFGRAPFKIQEISQNYRELEYKNNGALGVFRKDDCPLGSAGTEVLYWVEPGVYTSKISQAYVDSLAEADVAANGQAFANLNGSCEVIQRTEYAVGYRTQGVCDTAGEVTRQIWIPNDQVSLIPSIPQDNVSDTDVYAYAFSIGGELAEPGLYSGLYGSSADGSKYRVYEVGLYGQITRYFLCDYPPNPPVGIPITLVINENDTQHELAVYAGQTFSVDVVITGRLALVSEIDGEVGSTNFTITIPAGQSSASEEIQLNFPISGSFTGQFRNLSCSPSSIGGESILLNGTEYFPSTTN